MPDKRPNPVVPGEHFTIVCEKGEHERCAHGGAPGCFCPCHESRPDDRPHGRFLSREQRDEWWEHNEKRTGPAWMWSALHYMRRHAEAADDKIAALRAERDELRGKLLFMEGIESKRQTAVDGTAIVATQFYDLGVQYGGGE